MSYEIVKSIKIDKENKKVFLKSSSNNVYPKTYSKWEVKTLSKLFKEKGLKELQKEIIWQYWLGNFQKTKNNYEKSLILLNTQKYNWNTVGEEKEISEKDFKELLYQNYQNYNKRRKGKFVILNKEREKFITKFTKAGCYLYPKVLLIR